MTKTRNVIEAVEEARRYRRAGPHERCFVDFLEALRIRVAEKLGLSLNDVKLVRPEVIDTVNSPIGDYLVRAGAIYTSIIAITVHEFAGRVSFDIATTKDATLPAAQNQRWSIKIDGSGSGPVDIGLAPTGNMVPVADAGELVSRALEEAVVKSASEAD